MPAGDLMYKCRNCDEPPESRFFVASDLFRLLNYVLGLELPPIGCDRAKLPSVHAVHRCPDGARGVMDLVGARPADDPAPGVGAQASRGAAEAA
jgi:hypothetical protein